MFLKSVLTLFCVPFLLLSLESGAEIRLPIQPKSVYQMIFSHLERERAFGDGEAQMNQISSFDGLPVIQRSGRGRLYDQNIFLASLFSGSVSHPKYGPLGTYFKSSLFIDIGSAVQSGDGAPTVRDIWEDPRLHGHLSQVIATDIPEMMAEIDLERFPFPVLVIPMLLDEVEELTKLFVPFEGGVTKPLIFRSASSGPDLYYDLSETHTHLKGVLQASGDRSVLYLFNKFVLYKPKKLDHFELLGTISPEIAFNHDDRIWLRTEVYSRTLADAYTPAQKKKVK